MLVSVLGVTELCDEHGSSVHVGGLRRRAVLAALALEVNRVVGVPRLLGIVWDERPPPQARAALQGHIAALRRILPPGLGIETRDGGYRLCGEAFSVDSALFADLVARSVRERDDAAASARFSTALGLWRGEPLSDLLSLGFFQAMSATMRQTRARAAELWAWREMGMGTGSRVVPLIQSLVHDDPTRESLISVLMLCLAQGGRRAEAIEVFQRARTRLADELGTVPGPLLQDALGRILRGLDPAFGMNAVKSTGSSAGRGSVRNGVRTESGFGFGLESGTDSGFESGLESEPGYAAEVAASSVASGVDPATNTRVATISPAKALTTTAVVANAPPWPEGIANLHSLPRPPYGFVGRAAQLGLLHSLGVGAAPRLAVVTGAAGAGKTSLLLHWAHGVAERFPDGRLYADLGGVGRPRPAEPGRVLAEFLRTLGFSSSQIPESEGAAGALFRAYCRERRVLVVLDDARDAGQVLPLLSAGRGCVTVVASRFTPADLAVDCGAVLDPLPPLTAREAYQMLEISLGSRRVSADPAATARMIELCDRSPLALRIAASRLAVRPGWGVRDLVGRGDAENDFLDVLDHGRDFGLTAALNATRERLMPIASLLLPLLALVRMRGASGPEVDAGAAAALLDAEPAEVAAALRNLAAWNLLSEPRPGRYTWSSLVGCYMRGLLAKESTDADVWAAGARYRQHFLAAFRQTRATEVIESTEAAGAAGATGLPSSRRPRDAGVVVGAVG